MTTLGAEIKAIVVENNEFDVFNTEKDVREYIKQLCKDIKKKKKEELVAAKAAAKAEKPKHKKGVANDGNPKGGRGPSVYNIFVKEKRAEVKEANPDMDNQEIFKEIGRIWKVQKAENAKAPSNEEKKVSDKKSPEKKEEDEEEEIVEVVEAPKKKPGRKAIVKKAKKTSPEEAQDEVSE
jgi:hypothetical protein